MPQSPGTPNTTQMGVMQGCVFLSQKFFYCLVLGLFWLLLLFDFGHGTVAQPCLSGRCSIEYQG